MSRYDELRGGLRVTHRNTGWSVEHAGSGLSAATGLRQRRFAEEARDDLIATGADFTRDAKAISRDHSAWADVYYKWQQRARQRSYDSATFEYYSDSVHYGTFIPSARWAGAMRTATTSYDQTSVILLLDKGNRAPDIMDNRAYVRTLLKQDQPAFAAALEAAVSIS